MSEKSDAILHSEMVNKIKEMQDNYYNDNKKKLFFKKSQKFDCASVITDNIPLYDLISQTMFIVPNSNKIYMDYTFFKLYANPDNFTVISDNLLSILQRSIELYGNYQMHLNLESFTVSALERYKPVISHFFNKCLTYGTEYSSKVDKIYIYNTPKNFDSIIKLLKGFINKEVYCKAELFSPEDSKEVVSKFQEYREKLYTEYESSSSSLTESLS